MDNYSNPRELLAAIVDSSDDAIITKNLNGIITSWNSAAERIFGYTAEEAVGQPIQMLIPADHLDEEPFILQRIRRGERIRHYETVRKAKNGALLEISLTVSPIIDSEGKVVGASKIARDISKEVRAREGLQQSEEQFRVTLNSIGDAVIATDRSGKITFMNSVAERLTGWKNAEALGVPLNRAFQIINEFSRTPVENPVDIVLAEGQTVALANHTLLISRDGTERPIDDCGAPIRGGSSNLMGVVLVFRDVTKRREAELTALRLGAIVQNSEDAIIGKNLDGIITNWNEGAKRVFGYSADEIVGQSIRRLIPADLQAEEDKILERLRKGERVSHFETTRIRKDGRHIPISLTISPIKNQEGHIVGASKIARDISERKEAEKALFEARQKLQSHADELEQKVRERTEDLERTVGELELFSYSLTHDMRAPLRSIRSFVEIVLEQNRERLGSAGVELLERAVGSVKRMDRLILELLQFTRMSRSPVTMEPVDLERLIAGIIHERVEFQPPNANIEINRPLFRISGNEASLTQCLTNLLDNAVKFVPRGVTPYVRISTERNEQGVRLWIEDNGIGIEKESRQRLFQLFQRVHKNSYPGTGIGLAIVRKAVERTHGQVGVESEPGKGSRFWLQFQAEGA
jgi:PAS domain S-box-containing protein